MKRITYLWWTKESMQCRLVVQFHSVPMNLLKCVLSVMCSILIWFLQHILTSGDSWYKKEFDFVLHENKGIKFNYGKTWKQTAMNNSFWPRFCQHLIYAGPLKEEVKNRPSSCLLVGLPLPNSVCDMFKGRGT